jgi:hypothetical protein
MGVRLRLDDPDLVESLTSFLERRECAVDRVGAHTLEVELPHELHAEQATLELAGLAVAPRMDAGRVSRRPLGPRRGLKFS